MHPGNERRIRRQFFWLAALLILGSGLFLAVNLHYERNSALDTGLRATESLTRVITEQTTRTIQTVDQRLQLAQSDLAQLRGTPGLNEDAAHKLLRQHLVDLPFVRAIWVLDAQGNIQYDSDTGNIGVNLADRAYFQIYKTHPSTAFFLGAPIRSRTTGDWIISASRPLTSDSGQFLGVIVAAMEPPYFDELWSQMELGDAGSTALLQREGNLLTRSPLSDAAMGKNYANTPLFLEHLPKAPSGHFLDRSPVDGIERLFVYRTLTAYSDFVLIVGTEKDRILAPWRQYAIVAGGLWLAASSLIVIMCWILYRSWSRQDRTQSESLRTALRLSLGTDAAGVAVWDWNVTSDEWFTTPTFFTILGYEPEAGLGSKQLWLDRVHPEDRDAVLARTQAVIAGADTPYEYEVRLRHADGSWRWMSVVGRVVERSLDGKPTRLLGVRTDITPTKQASERLRQSEENLAITLQSIGDAVIATDSAGRITRMNATAERLTGWSMDEARDRALPEVFQIVDEQTRLPAASPVDLVMASGQTVGLANHTTLLARDGSAYQISDSAAPIKDAQQSIVGVVLVFSDVTDQYKVRKALSESEVRYRTMIEWAPSPMVVHVRAERVNDFAPLFVMNLLRKVVMISG